MRRLKQACFSHEGLVISTILVMGMRWESLPMERVASLDPAAAVAEADEVGVPLMANAYAFEFGEDIVGRRK